MWETEHAGHETELARRAAGQGWPLVVVVGGDGTVHGAVNGLLAAECPTPVFGHVPIGTGNDFAKTVGLDKAHPPEDNLRRILNGVVRRLDLGYALGEYFVNGLGVGFSAEVARNILTFRRLRGFTLYFASVLRTFRTFEMPNLDVAAPERRERGKIMMAEVAIGKTAGGGFKLTPDADPADGLLDVCLISEVGLTYFLRHVRRLMKGTHTDLEPVTVFQTPQVEVTSVDGLIPIHLDGELRYPQTTHLLANIVPQRLSALCASV